MIWQTALITTTLLVSLTACTLVPSTNSVPADTTLLTNQTPNPRGLGDPNAPVKIQEYTDYQ
jgi:hypothetical protein